MFSNQDLVYLLHLCAHLANKLSQLQLLKWNVPLLQVHTGLADLTGDWTPPAANGPTTIYGRRQVLQPILITLLSALFSSALVSCFLSLSWVLFLCLFLLKPMREVNMDTECLIEDWTQFKALYKEVYGPLFQDLLWRAQFWVNY